MMNTILTLNNTNDFIMMTDLCEPIFFPVQFLQNV